MNNEAETSELIAQPSFLEKLTARWHDAETMAAVGLDPDLTKIPDFIWESVGGRQNITEGIIAFNKLVIGATHPFVCAYKLQKGFYQGHEGEKALEATVESIRETDSKILIIYDGKIGDIENTAVQYRNYLFDKLGVDAVLVNPYMGSSAVLPFAERPDKGVVVLCRTSNPEAAEIQGLQLVDGRHVWEYVLEKCVNEWNSNQNIVTCLSATYPQDLIGIRQKVGNMPILLAGIGAQGGELGIVLPHSKDSDGYGLIVSSSRSIIFADPSPNESYAQAVNRSVINLKNSLR